MPRHGSLWERREFHDESEVHLANKVWPHLRGLWVVVTEGGPSLGPTGFLSCLPIKGYLKNPREERVVGAQDRTPKEGTVDGCLIRKALH